MAAKIAGVLLYRRSPQIEVFLGHMRGPFWEDKNEGAWVIPTRQMDKGETLIDVAVRGCHEEVGLKVDPKNMQELGFVRMPDGEKMYVWAYELAPGIEITISSNTCDTEWSNGSGEVRQFHGIDRASWFDLEEAAKMITEIQSFFLEQLKILESNDNFDIENCSDDKIDSESEDVGGKIIKRRAPDFGGILETLKREGIILPSTFPSLDDDSSWNTLPHGIPGQCRTALCVDVYDPLKVLDLLATALNHLGINCKGTTNSVFFVVSVDRTIWDPAWNLYAPAFKSIQPSINIEVRHVGISSNALNSLHQELVKTTTDTKLLNKWEQCVLSWDEERRRRFCLVLHKLTNDAAYAGRDPKIIGGYTSLPYSNQLILIYAKLHNNSLIAVSGTNNLRFKSDGTEYAKRIGYCQNKSIWQYVRI